MRIDEQFVTQLIEQGECEWVDFKVQHHENTADLVHDTICLSNADYQGDRFLVFGVRDNGEVAGIEAANRKTQNNIIDTLRSKGFNHLPTVKLADVECGPGRVVQVLVVKDLPEKPYFLLGDYTYRGKCVRAGVPYTRNGDTNTPLDRCPDDIKVQKMYRERFALDKPPSERVKTYLREAEEWKYGYDRARTLYFYYDPFPEFTFVENSSESRGFQEPWVKQCPDRSAEMRECFLHYHSTILASINVVWCDGHRFVVALPETKTLDGDSGQMYRSFYFIKDSLRYLVHEMISEAYPNERRAGVQLDFPVFDSKEEAEAKLQEDFAAGMRRYTYYSRDPSTRRDFVVRPNGRQDLG